MTAVKMVLGANVNFGLDTVCIDLSMVFECCESGFGCKCKLMLGYG